VQRKRGEHGLSSSELEVIAEVFYVKDKRLFLLCSDNKLYWPNNHVRAYIKPYERRSIGAPCEFTYKLIEPFCITEFRDGTEIRGEHSGIR